MDRREEILNYNADSVILYHDHLINGQQLDSVRFKFKSVDKYEKSYISSHSTIKKIMLMFVPLIWLYFIIQYFMPQLLESNGLNKTIFACLSVYGISLWTFAYSYNNFCVQTKWLAMYGHEHLDIGVLFVLGTMAAINQKLHDNQSFKSMYAAKIFHSVVISVTASVLLLLLYAKQGFAPTFGFLYIYPIAQTVVHIIFYLTLLTIPAYIIYIVYPIIAYKKVRELLKKSIISQAKYAQYEADILGLNIKPKVLFNYIGNEYAAYKDRDEKYENAEYNGLLKAEAVFEQNGMEFTEQDRKIFYDEFEKKFGKKEWFSAVVITNDNKDMILNKKAKK